MFVNVLMDVIVLLIVLFLVINLFDSNRTLEWKFVNFVNNSYDWVVNKIKNIFVYAKHNEVVTSEVTPIVCSDTNEYIDYFDDILEEMSEVHQRKNADYGNNFHKRYEKYGFLTALLRLTDKMERLENIYEKGEIQVKDESVEDTLLDLANYAVMTIVELRNNKKETD